MIRTVPDQRLEPTHQEEVPEEPETLTDYELEQQEQEYLWSCGLTDEQLNTIYRRLGL